MVLMPCSVSYESLVLRSRSVLNFRKPRISIANPNPRGVAV
eukprot:SAG31_NODE_26133_length_447_cov_4.143678_1_plen_40_part_10